MRDAALETGLELPSGKGQVREAHKVGVITTSNYKNIWELASNSFED